MNKHGVPMRSRSPITAANQNFSKVSRSVDEHGTSTVLKNNTPRYLVIDFNGAKNFFKVKMKIQRQRKT